MARILDLISKAAEIRHRELAAVTDFKEALGTSFQMWVAWSDRNGLGFKIFIFVRYYGASAYQGPGW